MKTKTLLIAAVMFLGLTAASFAQATFTVGSIPVTTVIATGVTEKTGDITFTTVTGSGATVTGTITISYGVPITNDTTSIAINSASWTGTAPSINNVLNAAGQVVITVPLGGTGSFTLQGVRVAVSGTGLTNLSATLSATGNAITAQQTVVQVISAIKDAIASATNTLSLTLNPLTGGVSTSPVNLVVKDAFLNGFGVSQGPFYGVLLRFTLSQAPPSGVTIQFGAATSTVASAGTGVSTWQLTSCDGLQAAATGTVTATTTPLTVCYQNTTVGNDTKTSIETVTVSVAATGTVSSTLLPLGATTINYTVSLAPLGTAFSATGAVIAAPVPRYTALEVASATPLLTVPGSTTTLLMPFGQVIKNLGYDTGLAIANTTTDPGKGAMGFPSAIPLNGTITFYMFQQRAAGATSNPAVIKYTTTAGSPGSGLDAAGNLPSGSTYVVLLSQVLAAAGSTSDFAGQIFVVTNFTHAHALYVISNFTTFSQGSLALVVPGDRTTVSNPVAPTIGGPERLNN